MSREPIELAPAAVVRVAGLPLARVTELADPDLAALALADDPAYAAAHAASIERQRAALWTATAADPTFMRALTLSNPELAGWVPAQLPTTRNKKVRHLETSLYRYLARAVARTEPNGLWSGVTLAHFAADDSVRSTAPEFHVAPDLAPYIKIFRALAERPEYRAHALWKLNPTLTRGADGWLFSAPSTNGLTPRRLRSSPVLDAILATLDGRFHKDTAAAAIVASTTLSSPAALTVLDQLIAGGVIVGGLEFPRRFTDPWHALALAAERLLPGERSAWTAAINRLRRVSDRLAGVLASDDIAAIASTQDAAREILVELCDALGVTLPTLPRAPLRCDLRAPFEIHFGAGRRAALTDLADEFAAFQAGDGMGGALGPALVKRWLTAEETALASFSPPPGLAGGDAPPCWEDLAAALEPTGPLAARVASWSHRLAADAEIWTGQAAPGAPGSPLGCLLFTFGADEVDGRPVLRGIVRDATPAFSRCAWLLEPGNVRTLSTWLSGHFKSVGTTAGIDQAELLVGGGNPNVLARPDLLAHSIDLWGTEPGSLDARGAVVFVDQATGAPLVRLPGRERPLAAHSLTAALVDPADHAQHLLLLSSLRTPPQIPRGDRVAFRRELTGGRHSPRVRLAGGAVVRTRRTAITGADLHALLAGKAADRFARWQRLAADRRWPALLLVRRDDEPALLVPRDSPLAIEALFEGAAKCSHLHVEEFIDAAWISDNRGQRYVAELALPFVRRRHLWSGRAVAADQRHAVGA